MKKLYAIFLIFIFSGNIFGQISKKVPGEIKTESKENKNPIVLETEINVKRPDFSLKNNHLNDSIPSGKIIPTGKHWYALEKQNDSIYWANVDCKRTIIEIDTGLTIENCGIVEILKNYEIEDVISKSMFPKMQNFYELSFPNGTKNSMIKLCKELKKYSFIKYVEPCVIIKKMVCSPNDTYWNNQWGPYVIYADSVYCYFTGGTRQLIGVIDNAVDWNHQDLYNTVWYGYDYADNDIYPTPAYTTQDHGTHVTGTIAAEINNNLGIAGIINDTIYFAKVETDADAALPPAQQSYSAQAILDAINYISTNPRIRTFNMSYGSYSPSSAEENALINAWNNGKLPIAAAGNDHVSTQFYPAAYSNVVAVSAVGVDNTGHVVFASSYSNYGNWIDISAPGGYGLPFDADDIYSTIPSDNYAYMAGTSMASPHATGVAGLIFAINPLLTNTQARNILETETLDLGAPGYDIYFGNGMVCAILAYLEACNQFSITITANGSTTICNGSNVTLTAPYNDNIIYQWKKNGTNITGATTYTYTTTQPGTYTLYIQSYGGCSVTSNAITIINGLAPIANFASSPAYIYQGQSVQFTDISTNSPTSWHWTFGDGGTSNIKNPTHTYINAGTYGVTLNATNACGNNTKVKSIVVHSTAGIEDVIFDESIQIFPNPASNSLEIKYEQGFNIGSYLKILDVTGKQIQKNDLVGQSTEIDISGLAKGVYFLKIGNEKGFVIKKFVKE